MWRSNERGYTVDTVTNVELRIENYFCRICVKLYPSQMHIDIHQFKSTNITVRGRLMNNKMEHQKGTVVMELRPLTPINYKWAGSADGHNVSPFCPCHVHTLPCPCQAYSSMSQRINIVCFDRWNLDPKSGMRFLIVCDDTFLAHGPCFLLLFDQ